MDDDDPGYEHDLWFKKSKRSHDKVPLRADHWYNKKLDDDSDEPEKSGFLICYGYFV